MVGFAEDRLIGALAFAERPVSALRIGKSNYAAIVMAPPKAVKPDPGLWMPLLDEYRLTSLPHDTVLQGRLRDGLTGASSEVLAALEAWPASAYLEHRENATHVVLVYRIRESSARLPWLHLALFLATLITTLAAGALMGGSDPFRTRALELGAFAVPYPSGIDWPDLFGGAMFALPFLGVLLAHEMGHYAAARAHRVTVTLPYFIPFPPYFSLIGTVGAFIRLKGPTVRRSILFDVGAAGPFASFFVSIPLLVVGLLLSQPVPGAASVGTPFIISFAGQPVWLGSGLLTHFLASLVGPAQVGEVLISLHPLALVGWLGLFVTALNLLPLGQLDGGHILYALSPKRQGLVARWFLACLIPMGFLWWGWWAWAAVVGVLHRGRVQHPDVIQNAPDIGRTRTQLGWMLIVIFLLTFVPVPLDL